MQGLRDEGMRISCFLQIDLAAISQRFELSLLFRESIHQSLCHISYNKQWRVRLSGMQDVKAKQDSLICQIYFRQFNSSFKLAFCLCKKIAYKMVVTIDTYMLETVKAIVKYLKISYLSIVRSVYLLRHMHYCN